MAGWSCAASDAPPRERQSEGSSVVVPLLLPMVSLLLLAVLPLLVGKVMVAAAS